MRRSGTAYLPLHRGTVPSWLAGLKKLSEMQRTIERSYKPQADINKVIQKEHRESFIYGGKTIKGR